MNKHTKKTQWNHPNEKVAPNVSHENFGKVRCSHIIIKHKFSRRPSSWKEANIERTPEEALNIIKCKPDEI